MIKISSIIEIVSSLQPLTGGHLEHTGFCTVLSDKPFDDPILWHNIFCFLELFKLFAVVLSTRGVTGPELLGGPHLKNVADELINITS